MRAILICTEEGNIYTHLFEDDKETGMSGQELARLHMQMQKEFEQAYGNNHDKDIIMEENRLQIRGLNGEQTTWQTVSIPPSDREQRLENSVQNIIQSTYKAFGCDSIATYQALANDGMDTGFLEEELDIPETGPYTEEQMEVMGTVMEEMSR